MKFLRSLFVLGLGIGIGSTFMHLMHVENVDAKVQLPADFHPQISFAPLVEQLSPAVVNIDISVDVSSIPTPFIPRNMIEDGQITMGQGSGFIISADGYILTNYHVVEGADTLTVKLTDNNNEEKKYTGTVVGYDDSIDVALVKIDSKQSLPFVELGNSDDVRVGDWALAIGNPFGLSHTVTTGIVSAKGRTIGSGPYDDFLQTDASINPGNSGGPLFNLEGQVIGINTAINPNGQGIGFSVPINKVQDILSDLKEKGHPSRGWLGVGLRTVTKDMQKALGIEYGALVGQVYNGTPAFDAGLQEGDIITHFANSPIYSTEEFIKMVGNYKAGESVQMKILRKGKEKTLSVKLGERPSQKELQQGTFLEDKRR